MKRQDWEKILQLIYLVGRIYNEILKFNNKILNNPNILPQKTRG